MNTYTSLSYDQIAAICAAVLIIVEGIKGRFKVEKDSHQVMITVIVSLMAYVIVRFNDNNIVKEIASIGSILLGSTGIYHIGKNTMNKVARNNNKSVSGGNI